MLPNKRNIELLLVIAIGAYVIYGYYVMFGIFDLIFLLIMICGINACWDRYFDEEEENDE
jgi:hypothetical protein